MSLLAGPLSVTIETQQTVFPHQGGMDNSSRASLILVKKGRGQERAWKKGEDEEGQGIYYCHLLVIPPSLSSSLPSSVHHWACAHGPYTKHLQRYSLSTFIQSQVQ